ncbi:MAG: hypothetical protein C4521_06170 [Actinobacteria bacterium]|nr:MAG: hypothetical protein C4521_06170 [Actinomycetota bacterium]
MRQRVGALLQNEGGFTTVELIVVSVLTVVVLMAVYNILETGMDNAAMIERNNRAVRDVGKNMDIIARYLRGTEGLDGPFGSGDPEDFAVCTKVDLDDNGQYEYLTFQLDHYTNELKMTTQEDDGSTATRVYAENVRNYYYYQPIFTYYDSNGNVLTNPAERAARTAKVKIRLIVDDDPSTPPRPFDAETVVKLRNRQS